MKFFRRVIFRIKQKLHSIVSLLDYFCTCNSCIYTDMDCYFPACQDCCYGDNWTNDIEDDIYGILDDENNQTIPM